MIIDKLLSWFIGGFLGFLLIAVVPIDDPLLIGIIIFLKRIFGLLGGFFIFLIVWFLVSAIFYFLYKKSIWIVKKYILKIFNKIGSLQNKQVKFSWKNRIKWLRLRLKKIKGADMAFLIVILGPIYIIPLVFRKNFSDIKVLKLLGFITIITGSIWYWWYIFLSSFLVKMFKL